MSVSDDQLLGWLGDAVLAPSADDLADYRLGIEQLAHESDGEFLLGLVSYAYSLQADQATFEAIQGIEALQQHPLTGPGSLLSSRIASAAILTCLAERSGPAAALAALLVSSLDFGAVAAPVAETPDLAAHALDRLAVEARARPAIDLASLDIETPMKWQLPPKDPESPTPAPAASLGALRAQVTNLRAVIRQQAQASQAATRAIKKTVASLDEELDLLWWTLAPYSDRLATDRWPTVLTDAIPVAAVELSGRMRFDPPLRGSRGLIDRVLSSSGDPRTSLKGHELKSATFDRAVAEAVRSGEGIPSWARPMLSVLAASSGEPAPAAEGASITDALLERTSTASSWTLQLMRELSVTRLLQR